LLYKISRKLIDVEKRFGSIYKLIKVDFLIW
jgi:hypothetical protein